MSIAKNLSSRPKPDSGAVSFPCHCGCELGPDRGTLRAKAAVPIRSIPPILLGLWIAFFPKCPVCWAAYMSVFGVVGAAQIPYMGWMYPLLALMLGIHLILMFRKASQIGYRPFAVSVGGAITILAGRHYAPNAEWMLIPGILLIAAGSLWSSLSLKSPAVAEPAVNHGMPTST